ncbi:glycoside hydrolase family 76 protein [Mycena floridula]|nr:glycoside hydrolase family 76 protein [Mycena floridula]
MAFTLARSLATASLLLAGAQLAQAKCQKYVDAASVAAANLQSTYFANGGYINGQQPWIGAVDAYYLMQIDGLAGTNNYGGVINTVFNDWFGQLDNGQSYDDVQWVALAYLRAGQFDNAKKYYNFASVAVDASFCGGGLYWSGARNYKNAITNELYMALSGYMYDTLGDATYLSNLQSTWNWLKSTPMRGSNGLFNDGLNSACGNNGQTQWTYNQGVILVGLAYLYKHTGDETAVTSAFSIMDSVIASLTVNGGLREGCESTTQNLCNADQQTFKGILAYYMAWFLQITNRDNNSKYSNFLKAQGDKVLQNAVGPSGFYSNLWFDHNAGGAAWTASSQASALGALIAAGQQNC